MSSSTGSPSNKIGWYKQMMAKLKREDRLRELAMKVAEGGKVDVKLPPDKGGIDKPKKVTQFAAFVEEAKIERQRRLERERKRKAQQKDGEAQ